MESTLTVVLGDTVTLLVTGPKGQDPDMKARRQTKPGQRATHLPKALEQKKQLEHRDTVPILPAAQAAHRTGAKTVHEEGDVDTVKQKTQTRLSRLSANPGVSPSISQMKKQPARPDTRSDARLKKRPRNRVGSRESSGSYFQRVRSRMYEL